ncbi:MAG: MFS transporter [Gammaproteobacteria bacterium]|nr:MFS transporter [Gammaproteobacteria bacterium]
MSGNARGFYGWRVTRAAFVLGIFGWGLGFYGPPVFLSVIHETRGWPLVSISAAVSMHFFVGALVGANLPALHRRFGMAPATKAGALSMAVGLPGWALAAAPWELVLAAVLSGAGWGTMSAAALNAIVSPWFVRARPAALGMAYNGGSVGGIIFSPLWVVAITMLGFAGAALAVALVMLATLWLLAACVFTRTPEGMSLQPDGDAHDAPATVLTSPSARPLPGAMLWRDRRFCTLAAGMTLGLFVQIGRVAHLHSLLAPALGVQQAGWAMGFMTLMAMGGRSLLGRLMPLGADRRLVACSGYVLQMSGVVAWLLAGGSSVPLLLAGVALFGLGFGNATSLPPLIAQVEFVPEDVPRVVALIVGIAQGGYAIAPAFFGVIRELAPTAAPGAPAVFVVAIVLHCLAMTAFLAGRPR